MFEPMLVNNSRGPQSKTTLACLGVWGMAFISSRSSRSPQIRETSLFDWPVSEPSALTKPSTSRAETRCGSRSEWKLNRSTT
ncbi:hypothetical protein JOC24_003921 [Streptomyces sp. HB132]|nr:hypothetical protein [Streptomyces sp. HB132]